MGKLENKLITLQHVYYTARSLSKDKFIIRITTVLVKKRSNPGVRSYNEQINITTRHWFSTELLVFFNSKSNSQVNKYLELYFNITTIKRNYEYINITIKNDKRICI